MALLTSSCMTPRSDLLMRGSLVGNIYSNAYWGFTLRVPDGWNVIARSKDEKQFAAEFKHHCLSQQLLTCYIKDGKTRAVLQCLASTSASPAECLSNAVDGTFSHVKMTVDVNVHKIKLDGNSVSHCRLIRNNDDGNFSQDLFAADFNGDTIVIILSQDLALQTIVPIKFIDVYFKRKLQPTAGLYSSEDGRKSQW